MVKNIIFINMGKILWGEISKKIILLMTPLFFIGYFVVFVIFSTLTLLKC